MKIKNLEEYKGVFFIVQDEKKSSDCFETYFDNFNEALHEADYAWYHMSNYDKKRSYISLLVSNTLLFPDESDVLASCDDDFILRENLDKIIAAFEINSEETIKSIEFKKKWAEKRLEEQKQKHKEEMAKQDKFMNTVKNSSDIEKCLFWKSNGYPQPSGTEILRIKKETGLSWNDFKKFIEKL